MILNRAWAMPNKKTFCIKPIKELINEEIKGDYIDPFPYPYKREMHGSMHNDTICTVEEKI
jgi:hypothetical protein